MKFSIRDLLLVTVIVALALGWWVDRRLLKKQLVPIELLTHDGAYITEIIRLGPDMGKFPIEHCAQLPVVEQQIVPTDVAVYEGRCVFGFGDVRPMPSRA